MIKIWHISDTHCLHGHLKVPDNIDMVIHSGDVANAKEPIMNYHEVLNFTEWYRNLPILYKLLVAGNHDISIERRYITPADFISQGIIYLENSSTEIEGLRIFGSPITPTFGTGWAFNKDRSKTERIWKHISEDTDIVITHGPAKGILDLSVNKEHILEYCGDNALKRAIFKINPKLFCFGHIHNYEDCLNAGYTKLAGIDTIFSNGSVITNRKFDDGLSSNGNIFEF